MLNRKEGLELLHLFLWDRSWWALSTAPFEPLLLILVKIIDSEITMEDFDGPHSLSMVISILNIVFLSPMLFGVILYEKFGSDKKRTLINQLVASIFWIMVAWNGTIHSTIVTRFIHGPFSGKIIVETFLPPSLGSFKPVNAPGNAAKVSSPPLNVYSFFWAPWHQTILDWHILIQRVWTLFPWTFWCDTFIQKLTQGLKREWKWVVHLHWPMNKIGIF